MANQKRIYVRDITTEEIITFPNYDEACETLNFKRQTFMKYCRTKSEIPLIGVYLLGHDLEELKTRIPVFLINDCIYRVRNEAYSSEQHESSIVAVVSKNVCFRQYPKTSIIANCFSSPTLKWTLPDHPSVTISIEAPSPVAGPYKVFKNSSSHTLDVTEKTMLSQIVYLT